METPEIPRAPERQSVPRTITPLTGVPAMDAGTLRFPLRRSQLDQVMRDALQEDGAFNDITTIATVVSDRRSQRFLQAIHPLQVYEDLYLTEQPYGLVCGVLTDLPANDSSNAALT